MQCCIYRGKAAIDSLDHFEKYPEIPPSGQSLPSFGRGKANKLTSFSCKPCLWTPLRAVLAIQPR